MVYMDRQAERPRYATIWLSATYAAGEKTASHN